MKMFMIKRKTKNTSVSATLISTASVPSIDPPSIKPTHSLNRLSRSNQPTMATNVPSPLPPDFSGYQSNPEDDKSYQSITHSISQQSRFPTVVSPDGSQSQIIRFGIRKSRQVPAFNLMVLGAKMTGKSTFLHTLISTLTPSLPTSNPSPSIISFRPTSSLSEKQVSITTLSGEKVLLNVIDTPGLDIHSHDDFHVDLQVNEVLRYIESKFDDSLHVERQVHRNPTKLGDGHVHVAIYFIDPSTILRERQSSVTSKINGDPSSENDNGKELHMSAIDLRQLKRLSRRCNILPVIGRSDELTEAELNNLKQIVRADIKSYEIDLGIFGNNDSESESNDEESSKLHEATAETPEIKTTPPPPTNETPSSSEPNQDETPKKLPRRKSAALMAPRRPFSYVMDSLHEFENVCGMIPLSVIGAEVIHGKSMEADQMDKLNQVNPFFSLANIEQSPSIFVRRFKWATVDVLNSNHCDFVLLRAVVLGSHFKKLKEATRLEKYEKYRTEKLLARRLTMDKGLRGIEEQKKIAMEVEKMQIPHIEPTVSIFASPPTSMNALPGKTRVTSHSKAAFKSATGWRSKPTSPPYQSQPNLYQPSNVAPSAEKYHKATRHTSHPHTENVNNNVPMVF